MNELDYEHLFFESNYDHKLKRRFSYSTHFSFGYQVAAYARHIPLRATMKGTLAEEKCLAILHSYLSNALQSSGIIEYYTCVSGKEDLSISKRRDIRWPDINNPYDLLVGDREFLQVTL
jgi:hypothetical protein